MTDIDEKIKFYKRDALVIFCRDEIWKGLTYAKWEEAHLKELQEQKAMVESETI
jgi:hypothetical protein